MRYFLDEAEDAIRQGGTGRWTLGRLAHGWSLEGITYEEIRAWLRPRGAELPSDRQLSLLKTVHEAWVLDAGLDPNEVLHHQDYTNDAGEPIPMTLTGVAIEKLWYLKGEVTPDNAPALLAWAYRHTDREARARKRAVEAGEEVPEDQEPIKSMALNEASYQRFLDLLERLREVTGLPHITRAQAFEFMVEQFQPDFMRAEDLDYLWRRSHGEVTEEEVSG